MSNVLIIAPHADDEILGCGGSINFFKRKGHKIFVAILTNANKGDSKKFSDLKSQLIAIHEFASNYYQKILLSDILSMNFKNKE